MILNRARSDMVRRFIVAIVTSSKGDILKCGEEYRCDPRGIFGVFWNHPEIEKC